MTTREKLIQAALDLPEDEVPGALEYIASRLEDPVIAAFRAAPEDDEPTMTEEQRQRRLAKLAGYFDHPETAPWDWEELREGKLRAWPLR